MAAARAEEADALSVFPGAIGMGGAEMAALALRQWRRALAALLLPVALAVALLLVLPPKYRAQSDILVKTGREYLAQDSGTAALTAPTSTKQEGINSEIALLTSRTVVQATIEAIGMRTLFPDLLESPPWFDTVADAAYDKFTKSLTVEPVKLSNIISVSYDAGSVELAQRVLDTLIATYIDKHAQVFAGSRSDSYAKAITREVAALQLLERDRTRIKIEGGIYDIALQRAALINQRVAAQSHLQDVVNSIGLLRGKLASLASSRASLPRFSTTTNTAPSDELVRTQQALVDARATEAKLATHFGSGYPDLQSAREQVAVLERRAGTVRDRVNTTSAPSPLVQQLDAEMVMDRAQLAPLADEEARYTALVADLGGELQRLEEGDLKLRTVETQIAAMNETMKGSQARYAEASTQEQLDRARQVSVVQIAPALAPDAPAKPRPMLLVAGGILLGLLGSGGLLVLAIVTSNTVVTEAGAERLLGLPVLAALPRSTGRGAPVTLSLD